MSDKEYEKDLNDLKEQILKEGDTLLTKRDLLERFCEIDKEYNGRSWNLLQILTNINVLIGQEFCEDCVSRNSLKHKLQERHDFFVDAYGGFINLPQKDKARVDAITNCIAMVVNEPPVIPAQKWIPVSERLPKPYTFVNATCRSLVDDRENWVVETIYSPIPKEVNEQGFSDWGNIPMLNWGKAEVIAWMHRDIPEPYQAGSDE